MEAIYTRQAILERLSLLKDAIIRNDLEDISYHTERLMEMQNILTYQHACFTKSLELFKSKDMESFKESLVELDNAIHN